MKSLNKLSQNWGVVKRKTNLVGTDDVTIERSYNFEKKEQSHDNNGYVDKSNLFLTNVPIME